MIPPHPFRRLNCSSLERYLKCGELIRKSNSSAYRNLENLIQNLKSSRIVERAVDNYKGYGGMRGCFIAFTAPTLTGKTQMAFTLISKLPIYFPLRIVKPLHSNFAHLIDTLDSCTASDQLHIENHIDLKDSRNIATYEKLRIAQALDLKLKTVGLLKTIIMSSANNYKMPLNDWMHQLANQTFSNIEKMPISDLQYMPEYSLLIKSFYIFIDEFVETPTAALLRNLSRIIGFTCVVASTNPRATNLIGAEKRSTARGSNPSVWSVVIPSFPKDSISSNRKIRESLSSILDLAGPEEFERTEHMVEFITNQCQVSRPGIANIIHDFFVDVKLTEPCDLDSLFTKIILHIKDQLELKKNIFTDDDAFVANVNLMLGKYFNPEYLPNQPMADGGTMVDSHFYYLKNPYTTGTDPFVLFRSRVLSSEDPCLYVCSNDKVSTFSPQCFFNVDEQILMLACLIGGLKYSIARSFHGIVRKIAPSDASNSNASSFSGNKLENAASAALIDSSHFTQDIPEGTLEGVSLKNFISNLLPNMNESLNLPRIHRRIALKHGPELENLLNNIKVPFLYAANTKVPQIYEKIFPENESRIRIREFTRTPNKSEVDAVFELFDSVNNSKYLSVVECKNWDEKFNASHLTDVLAKALKFSKSQSSQPCRVHFIFCRSMGKLNHRRASMQSLFKLLSDNEINVYCFKTIEGGFEISPASEKFPRHKNPTMVSFIIEINNLQELKQHLYKTNENE